MTQKNAIYAMYYTGGSGSGHAVFVMMNGTISGADVVGGILDGTYTVGDDDRVSFKVTLIAPAGMTLVTGQTAGAEPIHQEISATLPAGMGNGSPVQIQTPLGPVNVIFKKLRDLNV